MRPRTPPVQEVRVTGAIWLGVKIGIGFVLVPLVLGAPFVLLGLAGGIGALAR